MFELDLYEYLKANFALSDYDIGFGFGEVLEDKKSPYIIMYSLDSDGSAVTLCEDDNYTSGEAFMQFSIFANDPQVAFFIKRKLDIYLNALKSLTYNTRKYSMYLTRNNPSGGSFASTLGETPEILTKTFNYEVK